MDDDLRRRLEEAARLMSARGLAAATSAFRQAQDGMPAPAEPTGAPDREVIDVEARVVPARGDAGPEAPRIASESFDAGHFRIEAGARDYKLFEPARDGRALPLLVMLHGCTQDPDDFARGTRMNALARARGVVVLYPAQSPRANPRRCWNWFKTSHQGRAKGEPAILAGLVREVMVTHAIDPARVWVAGLSAGGAMAAILGDAYPELFAAVGVHSGLATGAARDARTALAAMGGVAFASPRPVRATAAPPTIVFHGDADATVNVVNVVNGERVLGAAGLAAEPGVAHGVSALGVPYARRGWADAAGASCGEQWTIHGVGHAWSGGDLAGSYTDPRGPDASAEMLRFFERHPRRG